jgi:hypothetical protein
MNWPRPKDLSSVIQQIKKLLEHETRFVPLCEVLANLSDRSLIEKSGIRLFFDAIHAKEFTIAAGDESNTLLISLDKSRISNIEMARRVLSQSDSALTPEQILAVAVRMFGEETELPSPNSLANLPGYDSQFYLLDRRTIGLRQHFRLPDDRWNEVRNDFYNLLLGRQRPISTSEAVGLGRFEWVVHTTASEVAAILRMDNRFVDLGRFLFALTEWGISERQSVRELIVQVLKEAATPLSLSQISMRIQNYRSVSTTSMPATLRNHPDVKEYGFGYYGLKSDVDYRLFFCSEKRYVNRLVAKAAPVSFESLCKMIDVSTDWHLQKVLTSTLNSLPKVRVLADDNHLLVTFHPHARAKKGAHIGDG